MDSTTLPESPTRSAPSVERGPRRAPCRGSPRDDDQVARLDGLVGLGDAGAHHVGPAGDERDRASVDRDDVRRRRELVRALTVRNGSPSIEDERVAVDEDDIPVAVVELDRLEAVRVEFDTEVLRQRRRDGVDLVDGGGVAT